MHNFVAVLTLITYLLKNGVFWVLTRATRRNNPEDTILHSHRRENLRSYNIFVGKHVPDFCFSGTEFKFFVRHNDLFFLRMLSVLKFDLLTLMVLDKKYN
jgi:hypothetical protein